MDVDGTSSTKPCTQIILSQQVDANAGIKKIDHFHGPRISSNVGKSGHDPTTRSRNPMGQPFLSVAVFDFFGAPRPLRVDAFLEGRFSFNVAVMVFSSGQTSLDAIPSRRMSIILYRARTCAKRQFLHIRKSSILQPSDNVK